MYQFKVTAKRLVEQTVLINENNYDNKRGNSDTYKGLSIKDVLFNGEEIFRQDAGVEGETKTDV